MVRSWLGTWVVILPVIIGLVALTSCSVGAPEPAQPQEPILLGLVGAMTGPFSDLGELIRNGAEVAADEINNSGGVLGRRIELVAVDTGGSPAEAVSGFKRVIERDKVVAVIGPTLSSESLAVKDVVNEAKIVHIIANASNPETLIDAPWSFNVTTMSDDLVIGILDYIEQMGKTKPAVLHDSGGFGQGGAAALKQFQPNYPAITFAAMIPFEPDANDLTPQVLQARESGADSVILYATGGDVALILKTMKDIGWDVPVCSGGAIMQPSARRFGDEVLEGATVRTIIDVDNPALNAYLDQYERKTGTRPILDNMPVQGYVAIKIFAMAVTEAGSLDRDAVKKAAENLEWKDSPLGPAGSVIKFSPDDHRAVSPDFYVSYRFENGQWVKVE